MRAGQVSQSRTLRKSFIFLSFFFFFTRIPEIKCIHVVQRNRRKEKQDEDQDLDSLNCFEQNYVKRKGQY